MATEIAVKERPIIFSGPMVRAIRDGRKTQTRRIIKPHPVDVVTFLTRDNSPTGEYGLCFHPRVVSKRMQCPYGVPGDRLWVRETWAYRYNDDGAPVSPTQYLYAATDSWDGRRVPSIHMPRCASRVLLEITDVRAQRVQEISEEDAIAEGVSCAGGIWFGAGEPREAPRAAFAALWDSINAKRGFGWVVNPWVWAISFKVVEVR